ncbi:MAG: BrnT family toxin [Zoogloeaceae bacterium]|jgi:uncharacterized DUF497 family protein|nr:BrnT family toxin [Zoogloeaceae bacterium]
MEIEFDPDKNSENTRKHGTPLSEASNFEWDTAVVWSDHRFDYDENRMRAIGYIGMTLYSLAFVERGEKDRIISLRRATKTEREIYARA